MSAGIQQKTKAPAAPTGKAIRFAGLQGFILETSRRGDGKNITLKTAINDTPVVIKSYSRRRSRFRSAMIWFDSIIISGKSSIAARSRHDTERSVLKLWRKHGFDVPAILDLPLPEPVAQPILILEYVPGRTLRDIMEDDQVDLAEKCRLTERLAETSRRRHDCALETADLRLIHEHPHLTHVIVSGDRLVNIDFEIVYRRRHNIQRMVSLEIAGMLRSLAKFSREDFPRLLQAFIKAYDHPERLRRVDAHVRSGTLPFLRWLITLELLFRRQTHYNKLVITRALNEALNKAGGKS